MVITEPIYFATAFTIAQLNTYADVEIANKNKKVF